ncbi:DoxX family protein [Sphingomonas alpina]|uniref:DoxX family protein n=1 Tax=Sphingomonas alpina TaxID=653931 RepID=A0A7H0LPI5_9SPHN|nr:DoxX family protein [Sphingomonas alpina]QNQ11588.1 DoxX family protein [Sphingomonas alpina]
MRREWVKADFLARGSDAALLLARVVIGAFLVWGTWDNVVSTERMNEFAAFLRHNRFAAPEIMAPLSVWAQFLTGIALILGLATRWAGLICTVNFIVALVMVDAVLGIRGAFPSVALILFGLVFATIGAGGFSIDRLIGRDRVQGHSI